MRVDFLDEDGFGLWEIGIVSIRREDEAAVEQKGEEVRVANRT